MMKDEILEVEGIRYDVEMIDTTFMLNKNGDCFAFCDQTELQKKQLKLIAKHRRRHDVRRFFDRIKGIFK